MIDDTDDSKPTIQRRWANAHEDVQVSAVLAVVDASVNASQTQQDKNYGLCLLSACVRRLLCLLIVYVS